MKKLIILILIISCLGSAPLKAKQPKIKAKQPNIRTDVDEAYERLTGQNMYEKGDVRIYLLGVIDGQIAGWESLNIDPICSLRKPPKDILDRFETLYRRNYFEMSESTPLAIAKTLEHICPLTEEVKIRIQEENKRRGKNFYERKER